MVNLKNLIIEYKENYSKENASLILFSDFLTKAIEGVGFVLINTFDKSNQYKIDSPIITVVSHIYNSSLLYYSKMFRGGNGVKREKLVLIENKLFDSEGNVKKQKNGRPFQPYQNRFYIEEFFNHDSNEFKNHHKILFQVNKCIVHIDKTDLTRCYTLLLFDKKETPKYLGIDNHFEYYQLPNYSELLEFSNLFNKIRDKVNEKISINTKLIHETLQNKTKYDVYYDNLIIDENEI